MDSRLKKQIEFIIEIDKLKTVLRKSYLTDASRVENSAEHSWHFAIMALVLQEYASGEIDMPRVLSMALVHDIVEIDAGDVIVYDDSARREHEIEEKRAARRIFGMLPRDQARYFMELWEEFEENRTPEARYARSIDRVSALMLNIATGGKAWREHGIRASQIIEKNSMIGSSLPRLWQHIRDTVESMAAGGNLKK